MRFALGFFKKIALCFGLLTSDAEPTPRTKKLLPPFYRWIYTYISAVPRHIFILLNWYGHQKNEPKFLETLPIFFNFNQFNNCPFFLPDYFITVCCLASKIR